MAFTKSLISLSGKKLIVPFYHIVSDEECKHIKYLYFYKNTKQFEQDLDFLLKNFCAVSIEDVHKGNISKPSFLLTFDDGLREMESVVMPMLLRKGIPAVFFVNPPFIDNRDLMFRYKISLIIEKIKERSETEKYKTVISNLKSLKKNDPILEKYIRQFEIDIDGFLQNEKPYMTLSQLQNLQKNGFAIGSHSMTHTHFAFLNSQEQYDEIKFSQTQINQWFSPAVKTFAFPFEDIGVQKKLFEDMYAKNIIDISFGTSAMKEEADFERHLHRINMEQNETAATLINRYFGKYILQKIINKHKILRK